MKDAKFALSGVNPMSQTMAFTLRPGEVKTVTVGGRGRPVTGKVVVNGYDGKINWRFLPPVEGLPDFAAVARPGRGRNCPGPMSATFLRRQPLGATPPRTDFLMA